MVSRAQVSLEFLMIVGMAMILMTASTYFIFDYTQSQSDDNGMQQGAQVGYSLVQAAQDMYNYGPGSFVTMTGNMPDNIQEMYVVENQTLVMEFKMQRGIVPVFIFSDVPINGTRADQPKVFVTEAGSRVHPGNTDFKVESMGDWVEIRQVS